MGTVTSPTEWAVSGPISIRSVTARTTTRIDGKVASPWHGRAADFDLDGGRSVGAEERHAANRDATGTRTPST
jgi:hypothetical protein